ncbi:hypothetical protein B0H14DRAFT_3581477, partial [Mycena olivaceomarginata]
MPQAYSSALKGKLGSQGTEAKEKPGPIPHDSTPQSVVTRTGTASGSMSGLTGSRSQPSENRAARPEGCEILDAVPDGTPILLGDTAEGAITHVVAGMSLSQLIEVLAQMKVAFSQNPSGPTSSYSWLRIPGICNYSSPTRLTVAFAPPGREAEEEGLVEVPGFFAPESVFFPLAKAGFGAFGGRESAFTGLWNPFRGPTRRRH